MSIWKICTVALLGVAAATVIRQWRADFLPLLHISFAVLFGAAALTMISPLLSYLRLFDGIEAAQEWIALPLKALGIALLTQLCSDICRESGESGLSTGVELVGKLEILLLCLPFMEEILAIAKDLLQMGG